MIFIWSNFLSIVCSNEGVMRDVIYVPDDYSTIQEAVNSANHGDTIIVRDGTYIENVNVDKQLIIRSENGYETTTVEAGNPNDSVFEIFIDNVTIDGFSIKGVSHYLHGGILLTNSICSTFIINNNISNNVNGVYFFYSNSNNYVMNNIFTNNSQGVIIEYYCHNNTIYNNEFINISLYTIYLSMDCTNNIIENNSAYNCMYGCVISYGSSDNIIINNTALAKYSAVSIYAESHQCHIIGNNFTSTNYNTIVFYNSDQNIIANNSAFSEIGQAGIFLDQSNGNNVKDNFANTIQLNNASDNRLEQNILIDNNPGDSTGITIGNSCVNNLIKNNEINQDAGINIYGDETSGNLFVDNTISHCYMGICVNKGDTFQRNYVHNNTYGILLTDGASNTLFYNIIESNTVYGIYIALSDSNDLKYNEISDNWIGVYFEQDGYNNTIRENIIANNHYGIGMEGSSNDNLLIHNNLLNNTVNAYDVCANIWNDTYPSGGNYWDDYTGDDLFSGPEQNIPGGDGIGDIPYNIAGGGNLDYYPLMESWNLPPFADFYYVKDNLSVSFNASLSFDLDGTLISFEWDFGDELNGTGEVVNHVYTNSGIYNVTLWVEDDGGKNSSITKILLVNTPPVIPYDPFPMDGAIDVNINIDLSWNCSDPDADILTYDVYFGTTTTLSLVSENQTETIYDPGILDYDILYYWQIVAWDNYGASTEGPIWQFTTEEEPPLPDLDCTGELSWSDVEPGTMVTGEFEIENSGDPESLLDWAIESYPEWGIWTFEPDAGLDLTPETSPIAVEVEVVAPDVENEEFSGEIKIVNLEDPGDFCIIPVYLKTPYDLQFQTHSVFPFLHRYLR